MSNRSNLLKLWLRWLTVSLSIGIWGCGTHQAGIPSDLHFAPLNAMSQRSVEYRIKPGDQLDIKFFYNTELNENLLVRPDSKISLQLIGDIDAAGRTPSELVAELKKGYSTYLQNPDATVIVKGVCRATGLRRWGSGTSRARKHNARPNGMASDNKSWWL